MQVMLANGRRTGAAPRFNKRSMHGIRVNCPNTRFQNVSDYENLFSIQIMLALARQPVPARRIAQRSSPGRPAGARRC